MQKTRIDEDELRQQWDLIIIGTGMGGATLGYRLAGSGRRILFIERGESHLTTDEGIRSDFAETYFPSANSGGAAEKRAEVLFRAGRWTQHIEDRSHRRTRRFVPFIGMGTGGSSALYGAAMERFFPGDFGPGEERGEARDQGERDAWPVSYDDLAPFYREAETIYGVRGTPDPLRTDGDQSALLPPATLSPANAELVDRLRARGLHPYQLPMAAEFVSGCRGCQGFLCHRDCKNDSVRACLLPALKDHGVRLLDRCEVTRLHAQGGRVSAVECVRSGEKLLLRGRQVVLAAGALATPSILLRSTSAQWPDGLANTSGMVGRNLMRHCIDLYALYLDNAPGPEENVKEIAFNDFYFHEGRKYGSVQSFGRLPQASVLVEDIRHQLRQSPFAALDGVFGLFSPLVRRVLGAVLKDSLLLATTLEDLPQYANRVYPLPDGRMAIEYCPDAATSERIKAFRRVMSKTLKPIRYRLLKQAENNERIAHACGTCRMGGDPQGSVVNEFNRAHDLENLYIVDASFFPTSGGINPSLTIAANALRVGDHLKGQNG